MTPFKKNEQELCKLIEEFQVAMDIMDLPRMEKLSAQMVKVSKEGRDLLLAEQAEKLKAHYDNPESELIP